MSILSAINCIRCCFESDYNCASNDPSGELEIFYAQTKDLSSEYAYLKNYITYDEQLRADKFHFDGDMETYISCHALLRLILSKKLNTNPLEISLINEINNRPGLFGNPVYFNITHTRDAFAFAVSKHLKVGIDMEKVNRSVDFTSIIETYFSNKEREYILESQVDARNRFFLLWTRKEALLKALGTGIITDLKQVEVSEQDNIINKKSFNNLVFDAVFHEYFIYSKKWYNFILSIAVPQKSEIIFNKLTLKNIESYLV